MPKVTLEYGQQQRERIIEGSAEAFARGSYRLTTIDEIAEKLKLSKGAIYLYFKSKEELFAAVFETFIERRVSEIKQVCSGNEGVFRKLEAVLDQFVALLSNKDYVFCRIWLESYLEGPRIPALQSLKNTSQQQLYQTVYALLAEGQQQGAIKAELDIISITKVILATCDGLILNAMTEEEGSDPEAVRRAMWNTFYNLLKAE